MKARSHGEGGAFPTGTSPCFPVWVLEPHRTDWALLHILVTPRESCFLGQQKSLSLPAGWFIGNICQYSRLNQFQE